MTWRRRPEERALSLFCSRKAHDLVGTAKGEGSVTIVRECFGTDHVKVPAIVLRQERPLAHAVVVHGYGGCKEEVLGLAWPIAEQGFTVAVIDLRGHGENRRLYDLNILDDVVAVVRHFNGLGPVVAVGHSLGGRLCLLSNADYGIAISPALAQTFSEVTVKLITTLRGHRVREVRSGVNFEALAALPKWDGKGQERSLVIYSPRDVPEVKADCEELQRRGVHAELVDNSVHGDIFLNQRTFQIIRDQLAVWFPAGYST